MRDPLREAWDEARWALGLGDDRVALEDLVRRYEEPHRAYHGTSHVDACLGVLDAHRGEAERIGEVTFALLYHDAVYDPTRADNEAASAALAADVLRSSGADEAAIGRIASMILATVGHDAETSDAKLLVDVDLSILGADEVTFEAFERAIAREYAFVPTASFRPARRRVLERFLARESIYRTPSLHAELEVRARTNLARRIAELGRDQGV